MLEAARGRPPPGATSRHTAAVAFRTSCNTRSSATGPFLTRPQQLAWRARLTCSVWTDGHAERTRTGAISAAVCARTQTERGRFLTGWGSRGAAYDRVGGRVPAAYRSRPPRSLGPGAPTDRPASRPRGGRTTH